MKDQDSKQFNERNGKLNEAGKALKEACDQLEEKTMEVSLLRQLMDISGQVFEPDRFYKSFVQIILDEYKAISCSLMIMDVPSGKLDLKIAMGKNDDGSSFEFPADSDSTHLSGEGVAEDVIQNFKPVIISDTSQDPRFSVKDNQFPIGSVLCLPLFYQDALLGVVNVSHPETNAFSDTQKKLMEMLCAIAGKIIGSALEHLESEKRFRSMFAEIPFGIIVLDPADKKIIDCNPYMEMFLGYGKGELTEKQDVYAILPEDYHEMMKELLSSCCDDDGHEFFETAFIEKSGSVKECEINCRFLKYLNREMVRLTIKDISEKKRLTEKLLQSEKLRSLGELAGGVAHDFNNVLAAILGRVQLMRMGWVADQQGDGSKHPGTEQDLEKNLDIIEKAALDGAETVRRIQEFAGSQDDSVMDSPLNIVSVIDDAFEFTRVRWKDVAESRGNIINVVREKEGSEVVAGNASELREVFVNLINNAVDAMPDGGQITVSTKSSGDDVVIKFEDTGAGIDEDIVDKIFDPFFTTKEVGSTGLGLSVTYGVIRRHGGSIEAFSAKGSGACFVITLPAFQDALSEKMVEDQGAVQKKDRVLVIEDEAIVADTICEILQFAGYEVMVCENGQTGINEFKDKGFDLVITDLGMPGMSGFDVATSIKDISDHTPVVMITGWKLQLDINDLKKQGVDYLISKPFQVQQVVNVVQEAIQGNSKGHKD